MCLLVRRPTSYAHRTESCLGSPEKLHLIRSLQVHSQLRKLHDLFLLIGGAVWNYPIAFPFGSSGVSLSGA